jgi:hypothetical protein
MTPSRPVVFVVLGLALVAWLQLGTARMAASHLALRRAETGTLTRSPYWLTETPYIESMVTMIEPFAMIQLIQLVPLG